MRKKKKGLTIPKRTIRVGCTRKIDGKIYKYKTAFMTKEKAQKKAEKIRKSRKLARVIPAKPLGVRVYSIWISKK